jgi:hypothetical protein
MLHKKGTHAIQLPTQAEFGRTSLNVGDQWEVANARG